MQNTSPFFGPLRSFHSLLRTSFPASALASLLALVACSSSNANNPAVHADGGPPGRPDSGLADAAGAADAAPAPVPEPTWSGNTIEPGCTNNGCIHAFAYKTSYGKTILAKSAAAGNPVLNGLVEYLITYVSDGKEVTGSVYFPDSTPPAEGFSVVVMNQFTTGIAAVCAPSSGELGVGVASAAALNGFVTIVPDATSFGTAPYGAYMVEKVSGRAALDAARAAFHTSQASGKPVARKAVIAGLSQGAFSTMAAATEYPTYANELEIRGFAAAEPPANLRQGANANIPAPGSLIVYDAMRLWSWQGTLGLSGGAIFQPPYDTKVPQWFGSECIFNGSDGSDGTLYYEFFEPVDDGGTPTVPIAANTILTPAFFGYAQNDSWPSDWAAAYAASATIPAGLKLPVLVFEGSADVVVLPAGTDAYVAQLQAAGVNVDYRKVPGGTHGTTALSSFTVAQLANDQAIAWFTSTLAN